MAQYPDPEDPNEPFMSNIARFLRLSGLFGDQNTPIYKSGSNLELPPEFPAEPQIPDYQPRNEMNEAYRKAIGEMPERTKPGWGRRILGGLATLGDAKPSAYYGGAALGFEAGDPEKARQLGDQVTNKPYYERLGDWKTKTEALKGGVEAEDKYNLGERQEWQRRTEQTKAEAQATNAAERTKIYGQIANNPNMKVQIDESGDVYVWNTKDANAVPKRLGNIRVMSAEEQARWRVKAAEAGARARAEQPMDPSQQKIAQYLKAREWFNTHERAKKYMVLGRPDANDFVIKKPSNWFNWGAADVVEYERALRAVYGDNVPADLALTDEDINAITSGASKSSSSSSSKPVAPGTTQGIPSGSNVKKGQEVGRRILVAPDGKIYDVTTWKASDIENARKRGYKDQ